MKTAPWRILILGLCIIGTVVAVINIIDVVGIGDSAPWLGAGQPLIGRWGAYFGDSGQPYDLKIVSVDTYGPAYRAELKQGDLIDVSPRDQPVERFWKLYRVANNAVIDLRVRRLPSAPNKGGEDFNTRIVTGPPSSLYGFVLSDVGSLLLIFLAIYFVRRESNTGQHITFATLLALVALGILADPANFGLTSSRAYALLGILNLALPVSLAVWAHFASKFGQPLTAARLKLEQTSYALAALAVLAAVAELIAVRTLWFNPVPLTFGVLGLLPMIAAIVAALLCNVIAIVATGNERKELLGYTIPIASIYIVTQLNALTGRLSSSYRASHTLLIIENAVILIAPLVLIYITRAALLANAWLFVARPIKSATRWVENQPNSLLAWGIIGVVGLFIYLFALDLRSDAIVISSLSVPKDLADLGFSPSIESVRLRDSLNEYVRFSQTSLRPDRLFLATDESAVVIPALGLPVDYVADAVTSFFGTPRPHVYGEFTESTNSLALRLRLNDAVIFEAQENTAPQARVALAADDLLARAPGCLLANIQPYLVAAHRYNEDAETTNPSFKAARSDAESIIGSDLRAVDPNVIYSHLLLASIYAQTTKKESDVARQIDAANPYGNGKAKHAWRGEFFWDDYVTQAAKLKKDRDKGGGNGTCTVSSYDIALEKFLSFKDATRCVMMRDEYHALYEFGTALNLDANFGMAWEGLALLNWALASNEGDKHMRVHYYAETIADLQRATQVAPYYTQYWKNLALYYHNMRNYSKALIAYEELAGYDPHVRLASDSNFEDTDQHDQDAAAKAWVETELKREKDLSSAEEAVNSKTTSHCDQETTITSAT